MKLLIDENQTPVLCIFKLKRTMLIPKEKIKAHIDSFEEDVITVDALIERLIFIEKLEKRIERSNDEKAKTFSHKEVKNKISKW